MTDKNIKDSYDKNEYPFEPKAAVGVVVINENDEILLIKRGKPPAKDTWSVPGGSIELGETIFEAAFRETLEETGLKCEPLKVTDAIDAIYKDEAGKIRFHYVIVYVLAKAVSERRAIAMDDAVDAKWFKIHEIKGLNTPGRTYEIIKRIINEARLLGTI